MGRRWWTLCVLVAVVLGVACQQLPPEEKIERTRAQYAATLNSISIEDPAAEMDAGETEGEEEATLDTEEEDADLAEPEPALRRVVLDILISTTAMDYLPGVTIDVSHADSDGSEKQHWRIWVGTADVIRGPGTQITEVLEDVDYEEGDGFHVEVRSPIPVAERGEYEEFDAAQ